LPILSGGHDQSKKRLEEGLAPPMTPVVAEQQAAMRDQQMVQT